MAAVVAARWDVEWDRGAGWWVRIGRRTRTGDVLTLAAPCTLEVRPVDTPSTVPAILTVPGVLDPTGDYFDLDVTREHVATLPYGEHHEYRVLAVDALRNVPMVLLRGLVDLNDTVGDM